MNLIEDKEGAARMRKVAPLLRAFRRRHNLTQQKAADLVSQLLPYPISARSWRRWENQRNVITAWRLADLTGVMNEIDNAVESA